MRSIERQMSRTLQAFGVTAALTLLLSAGPARAQDPTSIPSPLTLDDAVTLALQNNPAYLGARESVASANADVDLARSAYLPQVGAEAQYRRFETHLFFPSSLSKVVPSSVIGPEDDWLGAFTLSYDLYDGGARKGQLNAAKAGVTAAGSMSEARRADTVMRVHRAYFGLLSALENEEVARKSVDRRKEHLRVAEKRKAAGAVPQLDVLRARSALADAELALISAKGDVEVARGELSTAMGEPVEAEYQVEQAGAPQAAPPEDATPLLKRATEQRSEVRAAEAGANAAADRVDIASSGKRPRAFVRGRYGVRDSVFLPEDPDWSLGVGVSYSIFDGGATAARVRKNEAERRMSEQQLRETLDSVRQQVWEAWTRARESWESVEAAKAAETEADAALRFARLRYEAGAGTITDVIDAESAVAAASGRVVRTRYAYRTAMSALERATGKM
ncbi:MAG: TolC family protein [Thermoanaerobaculia bacterium]